VKALYYDGAGALQWREEREPAIEDAADAIVRPLAVSTCDLDQAIIHSEEPVPGSEQPFAIGHEGVGEVIEIGPGVCGVKPGDLVAISYHISCGRCDRCAEELPLFCRASLTLRSSLSNARSYMPAVLELLSNGRINPQLVTTDVLPFDTAAEALATAGFKPVFVREPLLTPASHLQAPTEGQP